MRGRPDFVNVSAGRWLDKHYVGPLVFFVVTGAILFGLACAGYGAAKGTHNSHVHKREQFGALVFSYGKWAHNNTWRVRVIRRNAARMLYRVDQRYMSIYGKDSSYVPLSEHRLKQVRQVGLDGRAINVGDLNAWSFSAFLGALSRWYVLLAIFSAFGMSFLINFWSESGIGHNRHLAELPWRKPWPWLVTITLGPIGWVCMAGSYFMLPHHEAQAQAAAGQPVAEEPQPWTDEAERTPDNRLKNYRSAPGAASQLYTAMRTQLVEQRRRMRLAEIDSQIASVREAIRAYGSRIKRHQQELNTLQAERQVIAEATEQAEPVDKAKLGEEFDRIMSLPGVIAVQVVNDHIRLVIRASVEYAGKVYDLGDWRMDFGPGTIHAHATELRSGVRKSWNGNYPVYRLGGSSFCFGDRQFEIDEHLAKGQFLEAMALSVECICSVNREHREQIPRAFKEVQAVAA